MLSSDIYGKYIKVPNQKFASDEQIKGPKLSYNWEWFSRNSWSSLLRNKSTENKILCFDHLINNNVLESATN